MVPTAKDTNAAIIGLPDIFPILALNAAWTGKSAPAISAIKMKINLFMLFIFYSFGDKDLNLVTFKQINYITSLQ
ncbi:MAG: hypothetical protein NVSMB45_14130 [Ginsengibacter sp.]